MDRNSVWVAETAIVVASVASREGGVDRNDARAGTFCEHYNGVASREGGVDRNSSGSEPGRLLGPADVASREGGVDRNIYTEHRYVTGSALSPPARGAWIATCMASALRERPVISRSPPARGAWIATVSLDRQYQGHSSRLSPPARGAWIATRSSRSPSVNLTSESPPARGAWIATSMRWQRLVSCSDRVASREGGVDRNYGGRVRFGSSGARRRLPRGGRGSQHASLYVESQSLP